MSHQSRFDARYFLAFLKGSDFVWDVGVWLEVLGFENYSTWWLKADVLWPLQEKVPWIRSQNTWVLTWLFLVASRGSRL